MMEKVKCDWRRGILGSSTVYYAATMLLFLFLILPATSQAQESCGNFREYESGEWYEWPVDDCENPFGELNDNPDLTTKFDGTTLENGEEYQFLGMTGKFITEGSETFDVFADVYLHDGEDYIINNQQWTSNGNYTFSSTGTYSVVITEEDEPILSKSGNIFLKILSAITPKAMAFGGPSKIITFTVVEEAPEPEGISNILFLPGIQASRLYSKDDGDEDKLWEPGGNRDIRRLAMTETGESIENIYAKEIIEELPVFGANVYKGFIEFLKNIDDSVGGPLVVPFPYDWRQSVFDIVENGAQQENGTYIKPVSTVTNLASVSSTGKVTLIAHSNGGLLAKAIMHELEAEGKADLIDKIIFIAVPHLGTPKGLAAILHGFDQDLGEGLFGDAEVVREVIVNMPGAYALLPSQKYLEAQTDPMISFGNKEGGLGEFVNNYGSEISNMEEYIDFLNGAEGRDDAVDKINKPIKTNPNILDNALNDHSDILDVWEPPDGIEVFNIVGTGLKTPKSITYKEYEHVFCTYDIPQECVRQFKLEPAAKFTQYGDETVASDSADVVSELDSFYVDLNKSGNEKHMNITESKATQDLVDHILHSSSTGEIEFVSGTEPAFDEEYDIHVMHSPARIYVKDVDGNISGRTEVGGEWLEEIEGSNYFEIGGVKYVVVPSDSEYEVFVEGEGTGIFTLSVERLDDNDEQKTLHELTASVTPQMIAKYKKEEGEFSTVSVDENGDGEMDIEITIDGESVEQINLYEKLENTIYALGLAKWQEKYLVHLIDKANWLNDHRNEKRWYKKSEKRLLRAVDRSLRWYKRRNIITGEQYKEIRTIIKDIKNS